MTVQRADAVILALWLDPMKAVIDEVADLLPGKLVIDPSNPKLSTAASGHLGESRSVATCTPSVD